MNLRNLFEKFFLIPLISIIATLTLYYVNNKGFSDVLGKDLFEFLSTTILPTFFLIIVNLSYVIFSHKKFHIDVPEKIESKKIKSISSEFINDAIDKISKKFKTLLDDDSDTILWEFELIGYSKLENEISKLESSALFQKINSIKRNRITTIANSLIHNDFDFFISRFKIIGKKNQYFSTETRRPSVIEGIDIDFRKKQKKFLENFKPNESKRILILSIEELIDEFSNNKNKKALNSFINWNDYIYDKKNNKKTSLNIVAFRNNIDQVFSGCTELDGYYDFVISRKSSKITVFAQKENKITLFDSEVKDNVSNTKKYYECYEDFIKSFSDENKKINRNIFYSKEINGKIKNVEEFIQFINDN